jgi:hypothetical protein
MIVDVFFAEEESRLEVLRSALTSTFKNITHNTKHKTQNTHNLSSQNKTEKYYINSLPPEKASSVSSLMLQSTK